MIPLSARQVSVIVGTALTSRLLLAIALGVAGEPEYWEYDVIAANLVAGNGHTIDRLGFVYRAYAPPLWSYVLAALPGGVGPGRWIIQVVQALFCAGAAVTCAALGTRLTRDPRVGLISGLWVALQPSLLFYSVAKSDPLPLNVLLLSLVAASGVALLRQPEVVRGLVFGLLVGLAVLSRGTPIVALPLIMVALAFDRRARTLPFQARLGSAAAALVATMVCIAPWLARNASQVGAPIITSTTGENLWRGNHRGADGGVRNLDGADITRAEAANPAFPEAIRDVLANGTELDRHRVFTNEALSFVHDEPLNALALFARKLGRFWWDLHSDPRDYPSAAVRAYEILFRCELALAAMGALLLLRGPQSGALAAEHTSVLFVGMLMVGISLLQSAFYVQGRHRFLIEPLLLVFSARALLALVDRLRR